MEYFKSLCETYQKNLNKNSIGILNEKPLHNILKYYFEKDQAFHEVKVGPYVCDIKKETNIIEIQTGNFDKLRNKLTYLLKEFKVNIIYPIIHLKYLSVNEKIRKSPKKGSIYDCFFELYKIKNFLKDPNLRITIVLLNATEFRTNTKSSRKGFIKSETIPSELVEVIKLDFNSLIPNELDLFTTNEFALAIKKNKRIAYLCLNILKYLDIICVDSKRNKSFVYKRVGNNQ